MFSRFDTIHTCDRRTDRQTDRRTELAWHIRAIAYMLSRVKNSVRELRFFIFLNPKTWLFWSDISKTYKNVIQVSESGLCSKTVRHTYTVWVKKNPPWGLVAIFPKRLGIFQPNFTHLLCISIYARLRIFIQISARLTKLCHIKHDHPVKIMCAKCPPSAKTHFLTFFPNSLEFLV